MIRLQIEEPKIEAFLINSKEEIIKALKFIADNNIQGFTRSQSEYELSKTQKKELDARLESFHKNPSMGKTWDEIKDGLKDKK